MLNLKDVTGICIHEFKYGGPSAPTAHKFPPPPAPVLVSVNISFIYLWLNEAKCNERDDKWFLEFPSEMIECGSVVIVNMCEA